MKEFSLMADTPTGIIFIDVRLLIWCKVAEWRRNDRKNVVKNRDSINVPTL